MPEWLTHALQQSPPKIAAGSVHDLLKAPLLCPSQTTTPISCGTLQTTSADKIPHLATTLPLVEGTKRQKEATEDVLAPPPKRARVSHSAVGIVQQSTPSNSADSFESHSDLMTTSTEQVASPTPPSTVQSTTTLHLIPTSDIKVESTPEISAALTLKLSDKNQKEDPSQRLFRRTLHLLQDAKCDEHLISALSTEFAAWHHASCSSPNSLTSDELDLLARFKSPPSIAPAVILALSAITGRPVSLIGQHYQPTDVPMTLSEKQQLAKDFEIFITRTPEFKQSLLVPQLFTWLTYSSNSTSSSELTEFLGNDSLSCHSDNITVALNKMKVSYRVFILLKL